MAKKQAALVPAKKTAGKKTEKPTKKDPPAPGTKVKFTVRGENYAGVYKGIKKAASGGGKGNYDRAKVESGEREVLVPFSAMSW